jgi:Rrf2 family protein
MQLTKRGEYALRTLIRLGIAGKQGVELLSVSTLAEQERLPYKFLENILAELRHAGIVESRRGKLGGVMLARPMKAIKMGEIVRLIDGKLAPIGCASETEYVKCSCPNELHCGLRMLMIDVRNAIANILDRYTLEHVVEVTMRKEERDSNSKPKVKAKTTKAAKKCARHADPADGFLAALLQIKPA